MIFSFHQHPCIYRFPLQLLLLHRHHHKPKLHDVGFVIAIWRTLCNQNFWFCNKSHPSRCLTHLHGFLNKPWVNWNLLFRKVRGWNLHVKELFVEVYLKS
jgi:hypothetical protein